MRSESRHSRSPASPTGRRVSRREALVVIGSATALPLLNPTLSEQELAAAAPWKTKFLTGDEVETVAALSECIISRDDTPGARDVRVPEYIDTALSRADGKVQNEFKEGLAWLETYVSKSRKTKFRELDRRQQLRLLAEISDTSRSHEPKGFAFLTRIKQLAIEGYYRPASGAPV